MFAQGISAGGHGRQRLIDPGDLRRRILRIDHAEYEFVGNRRGAFRPHDDDVVPAGRQSRGSHDVDFIGLLEKVSLT